MSCGYDSTQVNERIDIDHFCKEEKLKMIVILVIFMIFMMIFMYFTAHHDTIRYQTIEDDQLPESFDQWHIFFISDIHRRKVNLTTLQSIKRNIQMVIIGGDLIEKGVPLQRTRENIKKLKQFGAPIYFVWGNNDYEVSYEGLNQLFKEENVVVLKDSYINMKENNENIYIVGFDYHEDRHDRLEIDWRKVNDHYCLLLAHVPQDFYELENTIQNKINIVLSGHTHGGQIRLFGLGPYQKGGIHHYKQTTILVSEGYGYTF